MADDAVDSLLNTWRARQKGGGSGPKYAASAGLLADAIVAAVVTVANGAAAAIASTTLVCRVRLRTPLDNDPANPVWINAPGATQGTGFPLWPGDEVAGIEVKDLALIGASTTVANQKLHYIGEV